MPQLVSFAEDERQDESIAVADSADCVQISIVFEGSVVDTEIVEARVHGRDRADDDAMVEVTLFYDVQIGELIWLEVQSIIEDHVVVRMRLVAVEAGMVLLTPTRTKGVKIRDYASRLLLYTI